MSSRIRFAHSLEYRLKLNNKLYNNYPLLEIKDFGPPTTYGEDKELRLNEKQPLSPSLPLGEGDNILFMLSEASQTVKPQSSHTTKINI